MLATARAGPYRASDALPRGHAVRARTLQILLIAAALSGSANAAAPRAEGRSQALSDVVQCRKLTDPAARLACFDKTVETLDSAEARQDVVVVDRQQMRQARRTLFGIGLPTLPIFGNAPDIDFIDTTVAEARVDGAGRWTLRMADGARWAQTDDNVIGRSPKPGDKVHIKRGALGSYQMNVGGQPAVKAQRIP